MRKTPYEKKALDSLSLTVNDGEFLCIIGSTGSGKSTLIQHMNALIRIESGEITVDDIILHAKKPDLRRLRGKVGMVFQYPEYQLFEETVAKDVAFGPKNMGLNAEETAKRVREAIELCGLDYDEVKDRSPFELSGGQKRRAAIAGVVAMMPQILILDEPTAGLDPEGRRDILDLARRLKKAASPTVIMVSHNMDEVARHADRVAVIADGAVRCVLPPRELFKNGEMLEESGLGVPVAAKLWSLLKDKGAEMPSLPLIPEEFAVMFADYAKKCRESAGALSAAEGNADE
jgi:energy-coupling factor transport system ATP-binding protein